MKKIISLILSVLMVLSFAPMALAENARVEEVKLSNSGVVIDDNASGGYEGDYVVIYNPSSSSTTASTGSLSGLIETTVNANAVENKLAAAKELIAEYGDPDRPYKIDVDSKLSTFDRDKVKDNPVKASYPVGTTKTFSITNYSPGGSSLSFEVVAVGDHCTIWEVTNSSYHPLSTIDSTYPQMVADEFDANYSKMVSSFGDFRDSNGDGKVNLMFYNIDDGWQPGEGYVAGYFWSGDFSYNSLPMIHIDTYPGVEWITTDGEEKHDVTGCYGTFMHEFQHLINYSELGSMSTWLNEAFSGATEEMFYPGEGLFGRIQSWHDHYYSTVAEIAETPAEFEYNSSYTLHTGGSVYGWDNSAEDILTYYSFVMLFTQWMYTYTGGTTVYKDIYNAYSSSAPSAVANGMGMTLENVWKNFFTSWIANDVDSGYGFKMHDSYVPGSKYGLESVYDILSPVIFTGTSASIGGGGFITVKPVNGVFNPPSGASSSLRYVGITLGEDEPTPVTGFSIDETLALDLGTSAAIGTVVEPADASDYSIAWTSSATSVATVDNGTVTAMAYGTATITATLTDNAGGGTFTDTCVVTVAPVNVTGITVTPTAAEVLVGETVSLTAAVTPANASDYTVAWSTNKASVATVNNGVVTGVATGTATITATVTDNLNGNTYSASCEVTVTEFEGFMLADEIEAGGTYIIVAGGQGKAVSNNTVTNNYYLAPVDVTENSDDTLTVESSVNVNEIMWVAEGNSTSGWTFQSVDDGMYMGLDSAQYLAPSTTAIAWLYSENDLNNQVDTDGYYYLSYSAASTSNAYERFTTSKNTGNNIVLYKYVTATAPEPTTYTVTFKDWDGTVLSTQTVEEGAAATAPAAPSRTGYTFTGWDVDFSNVTSDLTVTAQYSVNSYTITYYVDGALYNTQTYAYGAAVTMLAEPTKEGYTFSGWDTTITTMPANDVTVNGTFTLIPVTTYTVTFMANGEVVSTQNVQAGAAATAPAAPEVAGYHFVEWDTDYSNVQSDLVVTAVYTKGLTVMTPGAQVRTSPTKGIRFATTVARDYDVNYIDITSFGTLLMPTAMLGENELTLETENVQNIESLGFSSSSTEERYVYFGSLLGLADSMLSLEITARGYVYYTFGGEQFLAYAQTTVSRSYNGLLGA